ncbi:ABC transporter substrate-binding protein [Alkalispirochaeta sphaeroplastigenens]|nr:extracellular solute-binding protein [Alkalispirochaeta sphaeroplastigenens]
MKRIVALALMTALVASALFAGGQKEDADGPVSLTYWTHEDPNRTPLEERLIREFEAANPGVTIRRVTHPSTRIAELLLTAFAANQGPNIFNTQLENSFAYVANHRVAPVNLEAVGASSLEALLARYVEGSLDPVHIEGKLYGLPLEVLNWSIFINDRIFRDAGLDPDRDYPKTWEDMVRVSEQIVRREGNIITRRGFDFRYSDYLIALLPMVEQLGGQLVSDDGKTAIVGEAAWLEFLRFMEQWGPGGQNLGSPTYRNARSLFNHDNDDIAMTHTGMYQQARIMADNPEFYESGEWRVVPFPVFENAVNDIAASYYGQYLMVNAQATERQQYYSWKFIEFMQQHAEEYLQIGIIQPSRELMESDLYLSMPYADVFAADMERARVVYHAGNSSKLQELFKTAVESVMLGGVSPERAYATLKAQAQEVIDEG